MNLQDALYEDMEWRYRLKNRPILTGTYLRASLYNRVMPRMRNQPEAIGRMMRKRKVARTRRREKMMVAQEALQDLSLEQQFERLLGRQVSTPCYEDTYSWREPIINWMRLMQASFDLENQRRFLRPTKQMVAAVLEARREKVRNKTKERERAERGYYNTRTLKRMRQGPPAHVLDRLTPAEIHKDSVVRSPSQVGYVAQVKRSKGMKLKRSPPWDPEAGEPILRDELNKLEEQLMRANAAKRAHDSPVD